MIASADASSRRTAATKFNLWLADSDLAGVREPGGLARLPGEERKRWQQFWASVKAALAEANGASDPLPLPEVERE